jgi:multidrug efflux pump subunit AcrB
MNPTASAMRHPITTLMLVIALVGGGAAALRAMRVDIFPPLNTPIVYVVCNYGGLDPGQVEGLITNQFEQMFQYVDGVKSVDSRSIQNLAAIQLTFFPGTDMSQATAQVVAMTTRAMHNMPPGTLPPLIIRMDGGSVPVGYLVMDSTEVSLARMFDLAMTFVRPLIQAEVPGTIAIPPYGANVRAIVVNVDPDRLRAYNLTAEDVVRAVSAGNSIVPAGNLYLGDQMPLVPSNAMVVDPQDLGKISLKPGRNVYLRDVARVEDATDLTYGYALVNGRKSIYIPMVKKDTASTLDVVARIRAALPLFQSVVPENVSVRFEFDESPTVVAAIHSVATEGLIGASLTGLMILLFLRDWRSVIVVVLNIPLALLGSLAGLWLTGHTLNIMTLGGLALAVGLLVDEATVSVENIHVQMRETPSLARAVERGSLQTAVPRLLAMLCILSVFIPAFLMEDPVRALFLPLALAVGFAILTSYALSSTLVPVLSVWLLRHRGHSPLTPDPLPRGESGERWGGMPPRSDG